MNQLYLIVGPTACGKGAIGRTIASRIGGQIISVDSMKVYRRMNIGTAKPSAKHRAEVPHHCIDLVEPSESFSVAQFVTAADNAIAQIRRDGQIPLAVGGTSLYIKALTQGLFEGPSAEPQLRAELMERADRQGLTALHDELAEIDPEAAGRIHRNDRRRIIRALEVHALTGKPISELQKQWDQPKLRYDCVFIGLRRGKAELNGRINRRVKKMINTSLLDEVAALLAEPEGISDQASAAVGYAEMIEHLQGRCTLDEAIERIKINTRRLAKKQRTWQRRFPDVHWFDLPAAESTDQTADRVMAEIDFT